MYIYRLDVAHSTSLDLQYVLSRTLPNFTKFLRKLTLKRQKEKQYFIRVKKKVMETENSRDYNPIK